MRSWTEESVESATLEEQKALAVFRASTSRVSPRRSLSAGGFQLLASLGGGWRAVNASPALDELEGLGHVRVLADENKLRASRTLAGDVWVKRRA